MKTNFRLLVVLGFFITVLNLLTFGQVSINTDGTQPDQSAGLDVKFNNKGFLLPRMSFEQRNAIINPAEGLMVYCTDCGINGAISVYSNGEWRTFTPCASLAPAAGTHAALQTQITWNWSSPTGAAGYKWNTINNYSTATDMGLSTAMTETGLACNTLFTRFIWAYYACGTSNPTTLIQTTTGTSVTAPTSGTHVPGITQIEWKWNAVSGATGYKWSVTNDNNTATDMGTALTKTDTGLTCSTSYTRYTWAYNVCGNSTATTLSRTTTGATFIAPTSGTHVPGIAQIRWNWNPVSGATGYKWSLTNDYATATDMGMALTKTDTGLTCNTAYTSYVWAYNSCGNSTVATLSQTTIGSTVTLPTSGSNVSGITQIIWNWNSVPDATGYKWNTTNNYNTAKDLRTATTKTETSLICNATYTRYVWAYNACGNSEPVTLIKTTSACASSCSEVTDSRDGRTYNTVLIGTQCWFAENLNMGTKVIGSAAQINNGIIEKYCYNDDENNCKTYGGMYQWDEAMQYSTLEVAQGICPEGWLLPSDADWATLAEFLGGEEIAGGKVKEKDTIHWASPNAGATNSSGFTALPGGYKSDDGNFYNLTNYAYFWSSTQSDATYAWDRYLAYYTECLSPNYWSGYPKSGGLSVRCMQGCAFPSTPSQGSFFPSSDQIIWNWNTALGAEGYRWNTINDLATSTDMGTAITKTETGLTCNTAYTRYVWAYNTCGISAPVTLSKTTSACSSSCSGITDSRDGRTYNTVLIGTQCWFAENLNIGTKVNGNTDQINNSIIEKYCYNDDEYNCNTYGGLYQWNEVMQYSTTEGEQGICPTGWHLPTVAEWTTLTTFLGGESIAGGKLKEVDTTHWVSPNTGATNETGFTALPNGYRTDMSGGAFDFIGTYGTWWCSAECGWNYAKVWYIVYDNSSIYNVCLNRGVGFAVRCLKD